jgi:hypothetical protein
MLEPKSRATDPIQAGQVWVEPIGGVIIARIRGKATAELVRECEMRIVALQQESGINRILYDGLELERPELDVVLVQRAITAALKNERVKVAIVVPNTAIADLARLAFAEANHRVFYNDLTEAVLWLRQA